MKTLNECILEAKQNKRAVGHFNVSNLEGVHAIVNAAIKLSVPVIVGVSEGERDFTGVAEIAAVVKALREKTGHDIFLNADHTYSFERVKEAIDAGFDAAIFDGAKMPMEENIAIAKQCVEYARNCGREVLIESELGYIGTSSKVLTEIPEGAIITDEMMTKPEDARHFAEATGINLLAPAIGNIHGMLGKAKDPALNVERAREVSQATGLPLVLHGASGNTDADVRACIEAGVAIVHVNTELRVAFRQGLEKALAADPTQVAPYKYLQVAQDSMQAVVEEKLKVFNNL